MNQALVAFRTRIGSASMGDDAHPIDPATRERGFTETVSRSSCEDRTVISARTVLSLIEASERRRLISEYLGRSGGPAMFQPTEAGAFLTFLAARLPYPSHALTLCHMSQALTRAEAGAEAFVAPGIRTVRARIDQTLLDRIEHEVWAGIARRAPSRAEPEVREHIERETRGRIEHAAWQCIERAARGRIERGQHATIVWFHAEPAAVLRALHDASPPPPVGEPNFPLLFAPGLADFHRLATAEEAALWARLPTDDAAPELIEPLLAEGAIAYADQPDADVTPVRLSIDVPATS
jgi:hypothetical protein